MKPTSFRFLDRRAHQLGCQRKGPPSIENLLLSRNGVSLTQPQSHWGFIAENNRAVDAFYKAAIAAGARDHISPRARLEYYPGSYAADVVAPDGYTFEVVHKS